MFNKIKNWWSGEVYYLEGVLPGIRHKYHWTAKAIHAIVSFYLNNWQWVWGTTIVIFGLIISYLKLS